MFLHSHFQKLPANNILYEHHPTHNDVCRLQGFLVCFHIFFLYHDFLFMRGSRIGEPVIPPKKQNTTDSTDTNQMATTINYFIIHCCQPNPSFIERNCCYHYYKCHSNRYHQAANVSSYTTQATPHEIIITRIIRIRSD